MPWEHLIVCYNFENKQNIIIKLVCLQQPNHVLLTILIMFNVSMNVVSDLYILK